jgi:hypothetical protein
MGTCAGEPGALAPIVIRMTCARLREARGCVFARKGVRDSGWSGKRIRRAGRWQGSAARSWGFSIPEAFLSQPTPNLRLLQPRGLQNRGQ